MTVAGFGDFPPHDPLFDSAWLKWGQAVVHSQTLEVDVQSWSKDANRDPISTFRTEYHPKRHGIAVITDSILVPTPRRWGLLLGDIANNHRSTLDQLAWALVTRGAKPPDTLNDWQQRNVYFPISNDRTEFRNKLPGNLPGVRRADIAKVRAHQPYHRRPRGGVHASAPLIDINTGDKHRTIQPIFDLPEFAEYEIANQWDCVVTTRAGTSQRQPLQVDTEVGFIKVRKTGPNPRIQVYPNVMAQPALEQNIWLRSWVYSAMTWVAGVLSDFSEPPSEINEIGIDWDRFRSGMAAHSAEPWS